MTTIQIVAAIFLGGGIATAFQISKGTDWHPWLVRGLAVAAGFGGGWLSGGQSIDVGLIAAPATLATHSVAFAGTRLGDAIQIQALPRLLNVGSELLASVAKAIAAQK